VPLALALRTTILHCGVRRKGSLHTAQRTKTLPVAETTARVDAQGGSLCTAELGLLRHTGTAVKLLPQRRAQTRESLGRCLLPGKGIFFFSKDPNWQSIAPNGGFRVLPPVFSLRQFLERRRSTIIWTIQLDLRRLPAAYLGSAAAAGAGGN